MIFRTELPQFFYQGASDQEKASSNLYHKINTYNPTARNRYDEANLIGFDKMKAAVDNYTNTNKNLIKKNTAENVKEAATAAASAGQSRGYGGSILEDMIAKAKNKQSTIGTSALNDLMLKRLQMIPGMMQQDNSNQLAKIGGAQGVDFQNIQNMFNKFGLQNNAIQGLDNGGWLTDAMAILNTSGNVAANILPYII